MNKPVPASGPDCPAADAVCLRVERLRKSYPLGRSIVPVLRDVSLTVRTGEIVSIIGASGSGKSTLLHILGALDRPGGGRVCFQDCDLYALSARQRTAVRASRIGFIFQFYHLLPELDVLENVLLPSLSLPRFSRGRRNGAAGLRARALLEAVGLGDRLRHRPLELSGGEQQRAAMARALINEPDLVLADEPTGNLDSVTGGQVLEFLFRLTRGAGRTLVLVTHNEAVAARCDRVLELKDGCLQDARA